MKLLKRGKLSLAQKSSRFVIKGVFKLKIKNMFVLFCGHTWGEVGPDGAEHVLPHKVCSSVVVFTKNWNTEKQNETETHDETPKKEII